MKMGLGSTCSSLLLQSMLQSAVQSVHWTYSLFWQICSQQGMLVWGDGYYNGAIKTRKTIQPMEVSTEEASLQRSKQLRDLYDSLSAAASDTNQPLRRPCAALSPEDLTETEWFYLMCISFSFPPGVGVPGKAYAKKQHVWITGANEIDSGTFSRAILAKSARIKTVVCIPLMDGVVELGTTHTVKEDSGFIQHIKSIFSEPQYSRPPKPALSELSTSNSATSFEHCNNLYSSPVPAINDALQLPPDQQEDVNNNSAAGSDFETETSHGVCLSSVAVPAVPTAGEPSELMQLELPEDIRRGSPDDGSNNLDTDFRRLTMPQLGNSQDIHLLADSDKNESNRHWSTVREPSNTKLQPPPLETPPLPEFTDEDTHYSHMVSTILHNQIQTNQQPAVSNVIFSAQSSFSKWTNGSDLHHIPNEGSSTSQWLLKHILHNVPLLHSKHRDGQWQKGTPQDELSVNHVLAERRRRQKLNEKFFILKSMVPFVTKMDKASILGDTIEYVKQLHKKIQDLEAHNRKLENDQTSSFEELQRIAASSRTQYDQPGSDKRKLRIVEVVGDGGIKHKVLDSPLRPPSSPTSAETNLQVSIIETDGLLEFQCPYKEGLLLNIMRILQELRIETTAVQSCLSNGVFKAEVKENMNGKKASIMEVKRAIQQIIHHIDT